jgi:hypothetical protein
MGPARNNIGGPMSRPAIPVANPDAIEISELFGSAQVTATAGPVALSILVNPGIHPVESGEIAAIVPPQSGPSPARNL